MYETIGMYRHIEKLPDLNLLIVEFVVPTKYLMSTIYGFHFKIVDTRLNNHAKITKCIQSYPIIKFESIPYMSM